MFLATETCIHMSFINAVAEALSRVMVTLFILNPMIGKVLTDITELAIGPDPMTTTTTAKLPQTDSFISHEHSQDDRTMNSCTSQQCACQCSCLTQSRKETAVFENSVANVLVGSGQKEPVLVSHDANCAHHILLVKVPVSGMRLIINLCTHMMCQFDVVNLTIKVNLDVIGQRLSIKNVLMTHSTQTDHFRFRKFYHRRNHSSNPKISKVLKSKQIN